MTQYLPACGCGWKLGTKMRISAILISLSVALGAIPAAAENFSDQVRDAFPAGYDLISNPERFIEKKINVRYMTNCFTWQGLYHCIPSARQDLIISSPEIAGDSAKEFVDSNCRNLGMARRCPVDIVFTVKEYGTDVTGSVRTIATDRIWARRRN